MGKSKKATCSVRDHDAPLISIIIVVFQDCRELKAVLESVISKKTIDSEIIVVDGASSDGSLELLHRYDSDIDYWVSEPDDGLYDAMNKGVEAASGRFIYHINAGDRLLYLPIAELRAADAQGLDIVSFVVSIDGRSLFFPSAGWRLKLTNTLHHQGTFYRRSVFPGYNLIYRVFADFDLNQRLVRQGSRVQVRREIVAFHGAGGISHDKRHISELFAIVARNYGIWYVPLVWFNGKVEGLKRRWATLTLKS